MPFERMPSLSSLNLFKVFKESSAIFFYQAHPELSNRFQLYSSARSSGYICFERLGILQTNNDRLGLISGGNYNPLSAERNGINEFGKFLPCFLDVYLHSRHDVHQIVKSVNVAFL